MTTTKSNGTELSVVVERAEASSVGPVWQDLERRANPSFFQSWDWIGTWLDHTALPFEPILATVRARGLVVGLGVIVPRQFPPRLAQPRVGFLHATGSVDLDNLTIEWNGFLVDPRYAAAAKRALIDRLLEGAEFDRLVLRAVTSDYLAIQPPPGCRVTVLKTMPAFALSHEAASDRPDTLLSSNTRQQLRRAERAYAKIGTLSLAAARSRAEAHAFLAALKELHQRYWTARGKPGAFAGRGFERFHGALIERAFDSGRIELVRIAVGTRTVGYLYNFRHRGRVYAYQSGFDYSLIERGKPGLVCHWLAIEHAVARGDSVYDFLAGDNQLKRQLSNLETPLYDVLILRPRLVHAAADFMGRAFVHVRNRSAALGRRIGLTSKPKPHP